MQKLNALVRLVVRSVSIGINTAIAKIQMSINGGHAQSGLCVDGIVFWKMSKQSTLRIGKDFKLNSRRASNLVGISNRASFQLIGDSEVVIGDNCGFTSTVLSSRSSISIGDNVKIGANVKLIDHDYHSMDYQNRRNPFSDASDVNTAPISIGSDVFVGTNSIILKGVSIGDRSVVGAGSVVTLKSIPADSLVAGNPAVIIRRL